MTSNKENVGLSVDENTAKIVTKEWKEKMLVCGLFVKYVN